MPKENTHYSCIACITIDSVINFNKKNHPQVCLEECKYRTKKTQIPKFIKNELKSDSDLESDSDLDSNDKELMVKLKKSYSYFDYDSDLGSEVESKSGAKLMAKFKKFHSDSEEIKMKMLYLQHYWLFLMIISFY